MQKGQTEFIAIAGIIVVIIIVIVLAFSASNITPSNLPYEIAQQQKLVKDSVINVGREGAATAVKWLEQQGGFLKPDLDNSVLFNNVAVPYWQKCGNTNMAPSLSEIKERVQDAVRNFINNSFFEKRVYFGKNVSFSLDMMAVDANILDSRIDFSVNLPTYVNGYPINQPYTFSLPTQLKEIHEFGRDFILENSQKRMLEHFTINTIYFSNELETQGILTECGEGIYLSGEAIRQGLLNVIDYTLVNTIWWQPMPQADDETKVYSFESVRGKTYKDLEIGLYLPDNFDLGQSNPLFTTNGDRIIEGGIWVMPVCIKPYNWKYSVDYPVILRVKDSLTGSSMNFAVFVDVNEMETGDCSEFNPIGGGLELGCSARIRVVNSNGTSIGNATASFNKNFIGKSDSVGVIEGPIACGTGELMLNHPDYGLYTPARNERNINDTYVLFKEPNMQINFNQVEVETHRHLFWVAYYRCDVRPGMYHMALEFASDRDRYFVSNIDPSHASSGCMQSTECERCREGIVNMTACNNCFDSCNMLLRDTQTVNYIPAGAYTVKADMVNLANYAVAGGFMTTKSIPERDQALYVYVPEKYRYGEGIFSRPLRYLTDPIRDTLTEEMKWECNLNPVYNEQQYSRINMRISCSCDSLRELVEEEFTSCIDAGQRGSLFSTGCSPAAVIAAIKDSCGYEVIGC